jgi:hypothetical protein
MEPMVEFRSHHLANYPHKMSLIQPVGRLEASYLKFGLDAGELFSLLRNSEINLKNEDGSIGKRIRFGRKPWRLIFRLEEINKHFRFHPYFIRDNEEIRVDDKIKVLTHFLMIILNHLLRMD